MIQSPVASDTLFEPADVAQRVAYLANAVVGHFSHTDRNHPGAVFDTRAITKLQDVAHAWRGTEALDQQGFRARFFEPTTNDDTVEKLRTAILGATKAKTYQELGAASKQLATAMSAIGLDRWPGFLNKLARSAR